ncbi:hypothetical protein GCM10010911_00540 [Paenibacillus nasutitermitis]|uniref:Uncharacterized protein n=1 Tax=Paenibacillus nasutitermitis TaxID=1652958 RepID=A0A916YJ85_9BACL|nr:hypothetical protein GCM10010911_00540 [Paenibacillus nasutitermitis]
MASSTIAVFIFLTSAKSPVVFMYEASLHPLFFMDMGTILPREGLMMHLLFTTFGFIDTVWMEGKGEAIIFEILT